MFEFVSDKLFGVIGELIANILLSIFSPILKGIPTLENLVFGVYKENKLVWGTFYGSELTNVLNPMLLVMSSIAGVIIVISVILTGARSANVVNNPAMRIEVIDYFKHLAIVMVVLLNLTTLYDLLFSVNHTLVDIFDQARKLKAYTIDDPGFKLMDVFHTGVFKLPEKSSLLLSWVFMALVMIGLAIWANIYYLMRRVSLIILMGIGPLMLAFWLIPKFRGLTATWLKELFGTIFVQSIHAFCFWTVMGMGQAIYSTNDSNAMAQLFTSVILWIIFIPLSESLRKLLGLGGDMAGGLSVAATVMGAGAIASMAGVVKDLRNSSRTAGNSNSGSSRNGGGDIPASEENGETSRADGANPGSETGTSTLAEKMLKAGDIGSKAGKAVFGIGGALAGAPLGPGMSAAMAAGGLGMGAAVGGAAGRGGAAAYQAVGALKERMRDAKSAAEEYSLDPDKQVDMEEALAASQAEMETATWADQNADAIKSELRQQNPNATPAQIEDMYKRQESVQRQAFHEAAKKKVESGDFQQQFADGKDLGQKAVDNMTNKWAEQNEAGFKKNWEAENGMKQGETPAEYEARKEDAWQDRKSEVGQEFRRAHNEAMAEAGASEHGNGLNAFGVVGREAYSKKMDQKIAQLQQSGKLGNPEGISSQEQIAALTKGADEAVKDAETAPMQALSRVGTAHSIAHQMATVKTDNEKQDFIAAKMEHGMTEKQAQIAWEKGEGAATYQQSYDHAISQGASRDEATAIASAETAKQREGFIQMKVAGGMSREEAETAWDDGSGLNSYQKNYDAAAPIVRKGTQPVTFGEKAASVGKQVGVYAATLAGGKFGNTAFNSFVDQQASLREQGVGLVESTTQAATSGIQTAYAEKEANDTQINPVDKAQSDINKVAYVAGAIGGRRAYSKAKQIASKRINQRPELQEAIHSPSEVIQMAASYVDGNGNRQIAEGAIQQVVTADESYIQVRGQDGQTRVVSRKGAGHSGMQKGDVVYRDLEVKDGAIVPATAYGQPKNAYRIDSGGGKAISDIQVTSNPSQLLGNPRVSPNHQQHQRVHVPTLNENVDARSLYSEDLYKMGMQDVQVVVEKDRSFVQAMQNGNPVRVSPIYSGDTRLSVGETQIIPGKIGNEQSGYSLNLDTSQTDYLSRIVENPNMMLPSTKDFDSVATRLKRQKDAEAARRKSGLLG